MFTLKFLQFLTLFSSISQIKLAVTRDFQQCGILTSVDSDEPVQPPFRLRNLKWCSVSSLTLIGFTSDKLWLDCPYAQADLRLCWLHIPHCWKSHALAQFNVVISAGIHKTLVWIGNWEDPNQTASSEAVWSGLVGWFCCFTSQVNSYGHCGTVSSPSHTFSWAGLNKQSDLGLDLHCSSRTFWQATSVRNLRPV